MNSIQILMMKIYKNIQQVPAFVLNTFLLISIMMLNSCKDEPMSFQEQNRQTYMMQMIRQDTSLKIAVQALEKAKMAATLDTYGPFTFFAPNNSAFNKYFKNLGKKGLEDFTEEELKTIMTYHILPTRLVAAQFIQGPQGTATGRGDFITLDISKGYKSNAVANGKATIYETDIEFANGFVHKMDAVLDPPTLTMGQFLTQNSDNYSVFISGLQRAGLMDTLTNLNDARNNRIRLTLFAETNETLQKAGITSFASMPIDQLKTLMRYHIVRGSNFSSSYTFETKAIPGVNVIGRWDNTLLSLDGDDYIYFNLAGTKLINNETIDFAASDIIMRNGVIHNLDKQMTFFPKIKRTQIYHTLSTATNFAYGIPGFTNGAVPVANASSGNWRTYTETGTGTSRASLVMTFANPDNIGDSVVTVVRGIRKGKYRFEANYKSGGRGDFQLKYGLDNIGVPLNYGLTTPQQTNGTYEQKALIGTYEFKTSGDKRLNFVCTRVGGFNIDCIVLTPVYD
ncbi:MAG: fasciclin domain-containing protein [Sphingobacteriaceae bacterium]|nr:MAG: fasciclin domain-containing protein [Sphingobacteriaceae bacterium]